MICDSHIHIGQFYDIYTNPEELADFLHTTGVDVVAISSTTTCEGNYKKVLTEIKEFTTIFQGLVIPVLWITPEFLKFKEILHFMMSCGINWRCIKVHPQLSPEEWYPTSDNYKKVVELAKFIKGPILIHTGVVKNCHPCQIMPLFQKYNEQIFIMAHGRPIEETISVLNTCSNTMVDTAFMPIEHVQLLVAKGHTHRILWGSDYPIIRFHDRNINHEQYYQDQIKQLQSRLNDEAFKMITHYNMIKLFGITKPENRMRM